MQYSWDGKNRQTYIKLILEKKFYLKDCFYNFQVYTALHSLLKNTNLRYFAFLPIIKQNVLWGIKFLPQTQMFWSLYLCNLMLSTFDISNLDC